MTEQTREAYPIQWNAPAADMGHSAWQGPRPDATLPAQSASDGFTSADGSTNPRTSEPADAHAQQPVPSTSGLGNPWGQSAASEQSPAQVGWAGQATTGETADEISQSHPRDDAAAGWSGTAGSTRFDAPDRDDHAPRAPQASAPAAGYVSDGPAPVQPQGEPTPYAAPGGQSQPASYASAPVSGSTGAGTGDHWSNVSYQSAPPQVVAQRDDLPEDSLTIGRSRDNSIVLDDMLVSRRHVVITADDEGLLLRDLGSRNGTFVNGRRVEQTHLHEGDRIGIGASTFEVRDGWLVSV